MNYEMHTLPPPSHHDSHHHPPLMTADTGVFRSATGLFLRKALIPGNLLYKAFYAKLTRITPPPQRSGGGVGVSFADVEVQTRLILNNALAEHVRVHVRKHWKAKNRDLTVSLAKPDLVFLGAGGVASFIRLQNHRLVCHFERHALAKSAPCSLPRQNIAVLNESLPPSLLPPQWPHTVPWLWLQCSRFTSMPTFVLLNSNIYKHKVFAFDWSATARSLLSTRLWMLLFHNLCHGPPWQPEWLCFKAFTLHPSGSLVDTFLHL